MTTAPHQPQKEDFLKAIIAIGDAGEHRQHPQRCNNGCLNYGCPNHPDDLKYYCDEGNQGIVDVIRNNQECIAVIGCASFIPAPASPTAPAAHEMGVEEAGEFVKQIRIAYAEGARQARERVLDEVIKIILAYERKPKYDFEATLCSVIAESVEALRSQQQAGDHP